MNQGFSGCVLYPRFDMVSLKALMAVFDVRE
jgi:hypothetical protein